MSFYTSGQVEVFPSTYRTFTSSGKFTNETNFSNIVKSIVDRDSYVLDYNDSVEGGTLRVVIFGYFFRITRLTRANLPKWLSIRTENDVLAKGNNLVDFSNATTTLDSGNNFIALNATNEAQTGENIHSLRIINEDGSLNVLRISSDSVYFGSNYSKNITKEINSKQKNFVTSEGLEYIVGTQEGKDLLRMNLHEFAKLRGLEADGVNHTSEGPILTYFDENGLLHNSSKANAGSAYSSNDSGLGTVNLIYLNKGTFGRNISIYYSNGDPNITANVPTGSIWIKYVN